jgi:hypothetical protein
MYYFVVLHYIYEIVTIVCAHPVYVYYDNGDDCDDRLKDREQDYHEGESESPHWKSLPV